MAIKTGTHTHPHTYAEKPTRASPSQHLHRNKANANMMSLLERRDLKHMSGRKSVLLMHAADKCTSFSFFLFFNWRRISGRHVPSPSLQKCLKKRPNPFSPHLKQTHKSISPWFCHCLVTFRAWPCERALSVLVIKPSVSRDLETDVSAEIHCLSQKTLPN